MSGCSSSVLLFMMGDSCVLQVFSRCSAVLKVTCYSQGVESEFW